MPAAKLLEGVFLVLYSIVDAAMHQFDKLLGFAHIFEVILTCDAVDADFVEAEKCGVFTILDLSQRGGQRPLFDQTGMSDKKSVFDFKSCSKVVDDTKYYNN